MPLEISEPLPKNAKVEEVWANWEQLRKARAASTKPPTDKNSSFGSFSGLNLLINSENIVPLSSWGSSFGSENITISPTSSFSITYEISSKDEDTDP